jgi:hypothetical protein
LLLQLNQRRHEPGNARRARRLPATARAFLHAVPNAYRHWTPPSWEGIPSERFTAIEQICHVRDIECDGYYVRLQRALSEDNPTLESLDGYALARERNYAAANAEDVLAAFRLGRAKTLQLISGLTPEQLRRTAVFEDYGPLTVRSLVHYLCSHDQQHLSGMQWLLGKIDAAVARAAP